MLSAKDKKYLTEYLVDAIFRSGDISLDNIYVAVNYILNDAAAIYRRCNKNVYSDTVVYAAIELSLYRAGFHKAAEYFKKTADKLQKRTFENIRRETA